MDDLDKKIRGFLDLAIQFADGIKDDEHRFEAFLSIMNALKRSEMTDFLDKVRVKALSALDKFYKGKKRSKSLFTLVYFAEQYLKVGEIDKAKVFIERAWIKASRLRSSRLSYLVKRLKILELILSKIDRLKDVDQVFSVIDDPDIWVTNSVIVSALMGKFDEVKEIYTRLIMPLRKEIYCVTVLSSFGEFEKAKEVARSIEAYNLRLKALAIIAEKQLEAGMILDAKQTIKEGLEGRKDFFDPGCLDYDKLGVSPLFLELKDVLSFVNVSMKLGMREEAKKVLENFQFILGNVNELKHLSSMERILNGVNTHLEIFAELYARVGMLKDLEYLVSVWNIPLDVEVLKFEYEKELREIERKVSQKASSLKLRQFEQSYIDKSTEYLKTFEMKRLVDKFVRYVNFFAKLAVAFIKAGKVDEGKQIFGSILELVERIRSFPIDKKTVYQCIEKDMYPDQLTPLIENFRKLILIIAEAQAFAGMIEGMMETVKKFKRKSERFEISSSIAKNLVFSGMLSEGIEAAERIADIAMKSKNEYYLLETVRLFSAILKEFFILKHLEI